MLYEYLFMEKTFENFLVFPFIYIYIYINDLLVTNLTQLSTPFFETCIQEISPKLKFSGQSAFAHAALSVCKAFSSWSIWPHLLVFEDLVLVSPFLTSVLIGLPLYSLPGSTGISDSYRLHWMDSFTS